MPKIFYWMTGWHGPSGGEKDSYRHVDALNASGFEAYACHLKGERYAWMGGNTRVLIGTEFWDRFDPREDFLVLPEGFAGWIGGLPGRKVLFNKNIYHGFQALDRDTPLPRHPYTDPLIVAIFTVSGHNADHLRFAFPGATIKRMYCGIDPEMYRYRPLREKKRQIAIVWKAHEALSVLLQILKARMMAGVSPLRDYTITFLRDLNELDAARVIGESLMLVSVSTHEGLPRTIVEGLSCGCILACYGTGGLKEVLPSPYAFEPDDLVGMARHIESVASAFPDRLDAWQPVVEQGRQIAATFSPARERAAVVDAWREIVDARSDRASQPALALSARSLPIGGFP